MVQFGSIRGSPKFFCDNLCQKYAFLLATVPKFTEIIYVQNMCKYYDSCL